MRMLARLTNHVVNRIAHRVVPTSAAQKVGGGSPEDPTGGHTNTPHTSQDRDVEGQDEDGELQ